ncbi:MAG TPA: hypothetical protein VHC20_06580 [Candidatus Paceibacterota bacterium]|nr:hypothetical protein [Candidatus Paceibacterota bacterium]
MFTCTRKAHLRRSAVALAFAASASIATLGHASPLAIGTVENFDSKNGSVVILGQRYPLGSAKLIAGSKSLPAAQGLLLLAPGALVWADGEFRKDGSVQLTSITVLPEINVPGSTQLFVAGVVRALDQVGRAKIGDLTIDLTPTLATSTKATRVGDAVEILGVQPSAGGVLLAAAVAPLRSHAVGGAELNGVGGTGLNGVGGTGLNGVGGTGLNGVGGTGLTGVGGTGLTGVGGTGSN